MEESAPSPLGILQIPSSARLLTSACCPDKDLVILISRLGGRDRLSLWNYSHGSKSWEVDVGVGDESVVADVVGLAWSPDGQTIAVVHHPPQVTLHSIQDGATRLTLQITPSSSNGRVAGVWWFRDERSVGANLNPDIFKRNDVITGSAHAILRTLPLLDTLQEDSQRLTATDLFALQGSHTKPTSRPHLPSIINDWPSFSPDPLGASINASTSADQNGGSRTEADESNSNGLLALTDDQGSSISVQSLFKDPQRPLFFAHPSTKLHDSTDIATALEPTLVDMPLLEKRHPRDLARLSSTARELIWYTMCVVKEMQTTWFGSESFSGARDVGPKWIQALEAKQMEQFGQAEPNALMDLTTLLVTGRATDSLLDFLGSGDQMSERGIQKWDSTMTEALVKLRDYSEKRIAPACQRLHLVLEELQGWSQLPQFAFFELSLPDINDCLDLTRRSILLAAWLAATARRDLSRFREFISWLRFEAQAANPANDNAPQPRHDILEVNNYFMSGISSSSLDQWFTGPVPQFSLQDLGVPMGGDSIHATLGRARSLAKDAAHMSSTINPRRDLEHLDRNIDALLKELANRCRRVFDRAAGAASRAATTSAVAGSATGPTARTRLTEQSNAFFVRERTVALDETGGFLQHLAVPLHLNETGLLCIVRLRFNKEALETPLEVGIGLLEPILSVGDQDRRVNLLEADFFDNESIVIVYRIHDQPEPANIATLNYSDIEYQSLQATSYVSMSREDLMLGAIEQWKQGHLPSTKISLKRTRALKSCKVGDVSLALNGRQGRRVACVLDSQGTTLESFDVEGDVDDVESDGERP